MQSIPVFAFPSIDQPMRRIEPRPVVARPILKFLWSATIIVIRHAERTGAGSDPVLSPAGLVRADLLAHMLQDAGLTGVFVTQFQRSVQTGTPAATGAGLVVTPYQATDAAGLAAAISAGHRGGTVLVVAHSNTVDDIATALGVARVGELAEDQFDRMFVITRRWCGNSLLRLRYGASTP